MNLKVLVAILIVHFIGYGVIVEAENPATTTTGGVEFGAWFPNGQCPPDTLIKAVRLGVASRGGLRAGSRRVSVEVDPVGYSDENGLSHLEIFCANQSTYDKSVPKLSDYYLDNQYSSLTCPGNTYASSFQLFFTRERLANGKPKSNVWYLGPHRFVNSSASSLHLFCGRSFTDKGADFYFGSSHHAGDPDVYRDCPNFSGNQDTLLCKIDTNKRVWNDRETYTLRENIDHKCCYTDALLCHGTTDFPVIMKCDNTHGTTSINCQFRNQAEIVYYTHQVNNFINPETLEEPNAPKFSVLAANSNNQMDYTLREHHAALLNSFGYQEPFSVVIPPYLRSGVKSSTGVVTSSLAFKVAPGRVGRVRRLRGICDGEPYAIETSIYETKQLLGN